MKSNGRRRRARRIGTGLVAGVALLALLAAPNVAAAQTGTVSGRLTSAVNGAAITSATVFLCTFNSSCTSVTVNPSGNYTATVPATTLVAYTTNVSGFVNEVTDDIPCPFQCDMFNALGVGTAFTVAPGATVTKNFALSPVASLSGVVRDASTGAPIPAIDVVIGTRFNNRTQSSTAQTDAAGVYLFRNLGPGTYFAAIADTGTPDYVREVFGGVPCIGRCLATGELMLGTPISLQAGALTRGIDFALQPGARITGTVRRAGTGVGLAGVRVDASRRIGSAPVEMASAVTDVNGLYLIQGLAPGTYTLSTDSSQLDHVYDGQPCGVTCEIEEVAAGRPVVVPARGTVSGIDFSLSAGGTLTGRLRDAVTGTGVSGLAIAYLITGTTATSVGAVSSNASGVYTLGGLPTGSYVVLAAASGHVSQLTGGQRVINPTTAELLAGARIAVTDGATTPNVDFLLVPSAAIRGRVRLLPSLAPAINVPVVLYVNTGGAAAEVKQTITDGAGNYLLDQIPAGFFQVATAAPQLDNQVFSGQTCPAGSCTPAFVAGAGTLIPTNSGLTVNNVDFTLAAATSAPGAPLRFDVANGPGGARFSWNAPSAGGPPTSYVLEAGLAPGATFITLPTTATSMVIPGIPAGTFFLRVRGVNSAGAGAPSNEITLRVGAGSVVAPNPPDHLFPNVIDGKLTLTWDLPSSGPAPTSYQLEVGTAAGRSDIAVVPTPTRVFQFTGVPPGFYFVRVRSVVAGVVGPPSRDVTMVVGNVPAPPSEPPAFISSVSGSAVTFRWAPPFFGPVTDYVLEAGTQPGASNITVFRTGSTATSITIPGVPPGRYFLRVRAVNAQGISAQSEALALVVP